MKSEFAPVPYEVRAFSHAVFRLESPTDTTRRIVLLNQTPLLDWQTTTEAPPLEMARFGECTYVIDADVPTRISVKGGAPQAGQAKLKIADDTYIFDRSKFSSMIAGLGPDSVRIRWDPFAQTMVAVTSPHMVRAPNRYADIFREFIKAFGPGEELCQVQYLEQPWTLVLDGIVYAQGRDVYLQKFEGGREIVLTTCVATVLALFPGTTHVYAALSTGDSVAVAYASTSTIGKDEEVTCDKFSMWCYQMFERVPGPGLVSAHLNLPAPFPEMAAVPRSAQSTNQMQILRGRTIALLHVFRLEDLAVVEDVSVQTQWNALRQELSREAKDVSTKKSELQQFALTHTREWRYNAHGEYEMLVSTRNRNPTDFIPWITARAVVRSMLGFYVKPLVFGAPSPIGRIGGIVDTVDMQEATPWTLGKETVERQNTISFLDGGRPEKRTSMFTVTAPRKSAPNANKTTSGTPQPKTIEQYEDVRKGDGEDVHIRLRMLQLGFKTDDRHSKLLDWKESALPSATKKYFDVRLFPVAQVCFVCACFCFCVCFWFCVCVSSY